MQNAIKATIKKLSARTLKREQTKIAKDKEYAEKYTSRTGFQTTLKQYPKTFIHKHFDPKYCKRHANFLAKTIWHKILEGTYEPVPAMLFHLSKPGGGKREVMQFSIPDAAVSLVLNSRLTARNLKRQSANSFAYRPDRNVFDALLKLKSAIKPQRTFVLQLDFEKYFDSIPQGYLSKLLNDRNYLIASERERQAIQKFLTHRYAEISQYKNNIFKHREMGTPQGSSISLTLANLANQPLDQELEAINGQFVRYADDTVVVSYTYEDAIKGNDIFNNHCRISGLKINKKKSPGIWILSSVDEELRSIKDFKFLGYGISSNGLVMHATVEARLKTKLSRLINLYLLHYIEKQSPQVTRAMQGCDYDLIGLIYEIRMLLYGGLSEFQLKDFIRKNKKLPRMKGLMGFYALLDENKALVRLDGWLTSMISRALNKRYKILQKSLHLQKGHLIAGSWYNPIFNGAKFKPDTRLPSFVRAWAAARKYYFTYGLEKVEPPLYIGYY